MGAGTASRLGYNVESSWGTPSSTAYTLVRKLPGASLNLERTQIQTQELNNRRAVTSMRLGTRRPRASIPYELFYGASGTQFPDFMSSWMCNTVTAAGSAATWTGGFTIGTITNGVAVITGVTPGGTALTANDVGKWYKVSGASNAAVNTYYRLVAFTSSTSFSLAMGNITTTGSMGTGVSMTPVAYIVPGTTKRSIAFEEAQTDLSSTLYKQMTGGIADTFSLNISPDSIITGDFGFFGKAFATGTVAYSATTPAAPTTDPMTANDTYTYLMADNVPVAVITNLTINGANNNEDQFPVGSVTPYDIGLGVSTLSGTMDIYLLDGTYWSAYQNETTLGLSARLMDPATTGSAAGTGYAIDIPKLKITNLTENKTQTNVIQSVSWMALEQSAAGTTGGATVNMRLSILA